jgi:hypothetical protein
VRARASVLTWRESTVLEAADVALQDAAVNLHGSNECGPEHSGVLAHRWPHPKGPTMAP